MILHKALKPGDRLPGDKQLSDMLGVSVITVRRALYDLQQEGLIIRRQGKGTFLRRLDLMAAGSLQDSLRGFGVTVTTKEVRVTRRRARKSEYTALKLHSQDSVWHIWRLRSVMDSGFVIDESVIPVSMTGSFTEADILDAADGLYQALSARLGLRAVFEEKNIEARMPTKRERQILQLSDNEPVLVVWGKAVTENEQPFDKYRMIFNAANLRLSISGPPRPIEILNQVDEPS